MIDKRQLLAFKWRVLNSFRMLKSEPLSLSLCIVSKSLLFHTHIQRRLLLSSIVFSFNTSKLGIFYTLLTPMYMLQICIAIEWDLCVLFIKSLSKPSWNVSWITISITWIVQQLKIAFLETKRKAWTLTLLKVETVWCLKKKKKKTKIIEVT